MNLLGSVIFGFQGSHSIFGVPVKFEKDPQRQEGGFFSTIAKISSLHMLHYCHTLVHEMGHVIAYKCLGMNPSVTVYTNSYNKLKDTKVSFCPVAKTTIQKKSSATSLQDTICLAAGSITNIAFSILKIALIFQLESNCLTRKSRFFEIASSLFMHGSLDAIAHEVAYALQSAVAKDDGDFGIIAKNGKSHLLMASSVMITELALCILVFSKYKKDIVPSIKFIAGFHLLLNANRIITSIKRLT